MFTITFIFINNDRFVLQIVKHTVKPQVNKLILSTLKCKLKVIFLNDMKRI